MVDGGPVIIGGLEIHHVLGSTQLVSQTRGQVLSVTALGNYNLDVKQDCLAMSHPSRDIKNDIPSR